MILWRVIYERKKPVFLVVSRTNWRLYNATHFLKDSMHLWKQLNGTRQHVCATQLAAGDTTSICSCPTPCYARVSFTSNPVLSQQMRFFSSMQDRKTARGFKLADLPAVIRGASRTPDTDVRCLAPLTVDATAPWQQYFFLHFQRSSADTARLRCIQNSVCSLDWKRSVSRCRAYGNFTRRGAQAKDSKRSHSPDADFPCKESKTLILRCFSLFVF